MPTAAAALADLPFDSSPWRGLEHNPRVTIRSDTVYGGPEAEPTADRRWVMDVDELQRLLDVARRSPTGRVVVHHAGLRVRRVLDGSHTVEMLAMVGSEPVPEPFSLFGGGK